MKVLLVCLLLTAFALPAAAQTKPIDFASHAFLWSSVAADLYTTHRALKVPGVFETQAAGQTAKGQAVVVVGVAVIIEVLAYKIDRLGHPGAARWVRVFTGGLHYGAAAWNRSLYVGK